MTSHPGWIEPGLWGVEAKGEQVGSGEVRAWDRGPQPCSWQPEGRWALTSGTHAASPFPLPHHHPQLWPFDLWAEPIMFQWRSLQGWVKTFEDTLLHVGTGAHTGFLLLPPNQNVFQNSPKNADVFLSSDLWKAIKDTGKADNPLSFEDWEWQWPVCMCVCPRPLWNSWLQTPTPPSPTWVLTCQSALLIAFSPQHSANHEKWPWMVDTLPET